MARGRKKAGEAITAITESFVGSEIEAIKAHAINAKAINAKAINAMPIDIASLPREKLEVIEKGAITAMGIQGRWPYIHADRINVFVEPKTLWQRIKGWFGSKQ